MRWDGVSGFLRPVSSMLHLAWPRQVKRHERRTPAASAAPQMRWDGVAGDRRARHRLDEHRDVVTGRHPRNVWKQQPCPAGHRRRRPDGDRRTGSLEEALFLTKFARSVTVVHRRDGLRASKIMQDRAFANEKITFRWNSEVVEVHGEDRVTGVQLRDTVTGEESACSSP